MSVNYSAGGPAFPFVYKDESKEIPSIEVHVGMSLRDYFAAQAMTGITDLHMLRDSHNMSEVELQIVNAAALAYRLADAMLKERAK